MFYAGDECKPAMSVRADIVNECRPDGFLEGFFTENGDELVSVSQDQKRLYLETPNQAFGPPHDSYTLGVLLGEICPENDNYIRSIEVKNEEDDKPGIEYQICNASAMGQKRRDYKIYCRRKQFDYI